MNALATYDDNPNSNNYALMIHDQQCLAQAVLASKACEGSNIAIIELASKNRIEPVLDTYEKVCAASGLTVDQFNIYLKKLALSTKKPDLDEMSPKALYEAYTDGNLGFGECDALVSLARKVKDATPAKDISGQINVQFSQEMSDVIDSD